MDAKTNSESVSARYDSSHVHNFAIYGCWCGARQCAAIFIPAQSMENMFCKEVAEEGADYCRLHNQPELRDDY